MTTPPERQFAKHELLAAARLGNPAAWEELIREFRRYLEVVAARTLHGGNVHDYSSVVQEGVVRAFQRIEQFRGMTNEELLAWLAKIVANLAKDRNAQRAHAPQPIAADLGEVLFDDCSSPSSALSRRERAALVVNAVDKLPDEYRQVIQLRAFQNQDYDQIAERLGRSNDAVRWLWVRAIRSLRKELEDKL